MTERSPAIVLAVDALSAMYANRPYDAARQLVSMTPSELRQLRMNLQALSRLVAMEQKRQPPRHQVYEQPERAYPGMDDGDAA